MKDELVLCLIVGFISSMIGTFIGQAFETYSWRKTAIEMGYAMYCPVDGRFAWKGECDAN